MHICSVSTVLDSNPGITVPQSNDLEERLPVFNARSCHVVDRAVGSEEHVPLAIFRAFPHQHSPYLPIHA